MVRNSDGSLDQKWIRAVQILGKTEGRPKNNQVQNKQAHDAAKKYNLSKEDQELLHRRMKDYPHNYNDILDEAADIASMGGKYVK